MRRMHYCKALIIRESLILASSTQRGMFADSKPVSCTKGVQGVVTNLPNRFKMLVFMLRIVNSSFLRFQKF